MLNPRQVEAFRAVMTTGSVTSAATTMHVTQPAVSRLIRDLELTLKLQITIRFDVRNWTIFNQNHSNNDQEYSGGLAIFF